MSELNEKQIDAVNEIHTAIVKLQRLVGDILTTQKLDLGKLDFNKEKTNVLEILYSVMKEFQSVTEEKKILLEMNFNKDVNILTDKDRINQVFSNLIKNSMDFVSKNKGIITIGTKDGEDLGIWVESKENVQTTFFFTVPKK